MGSKKGAKGTKLPVSALGESLAGKEGTRTYTMGSSTSSGSKPFSSGRSGAGGRGGGAGGASGTRRSDAEGTWGRKEASSANGGGGGSGPGMMGSSDAGRGGGGRGASGRGARGGRGGGGSNATFAAAAAAGHGGIAMAAGYDSLGSGAAVAVGAGGGPAAGASAGAGGNGTMYYSANAMYNVFYPPTAYGYQPSAAGPVGISKEQIMESVKHQIDYYFSVENMVKDIFLRSKVGAISLVKVRREGAATSCALDTYRLLPCWLMQHVHCARACVLHFGRTTLQSRYCSLVCAMCILQLSALLSVSPGPLLLPSISLSLLSSIMPPCTLYVATCVTMLTLTRAM